MQPKNILAAIGFVAATQAAALPVAENQLEARAAVASAPFKIRRFTPLAGFDVTKPATWSNNQYTSVTKANGFLTYDGISLALASTWTYDTEGKLRGVGEGNLGLSPKSLQSYEFTVTPIIFGGPGEDVKVTIGPAPLYEVTFQTVRSGSPVAGWTALGQLGSNVLLGKSASISSLVRFRAEGYTPAVAAP